MFRSASDRALVTLRSTARDSFGAGVVSNAWFNSVNYERYCELYGNQLASLSARFVWDELHRLVAPHEPVLLCWERSPLTSANWCHRMLVSQWFKHEFDVVVPEFAQAEELPRRRATPQGRCG